MLAINLLPVREVRKRAEAQQTLRQLVLVLVLTACAVGAVHSRLGSEMDRSAARIQQMERDIAQFKPQLDQVEAFKKKKSELQKKIDVIDGLDRARRGPVRVMAELADRIPPRVWITSLDTSGATVKMTGQSLDNELVALFLRDLGASPYFDQIDLEGTKLEGSKSGLKLVKFEMKAELAGVKPPPAPDAKGKAQPGKRKGRAAGAKPGARKG
jgi:type IV pilus assembly protein PilN